MSKVIIGLLLTCGCENVPLHKPISLYHWLWDYIFPQFCLVSMRHKNNRPTGSGLYDPTLLRPAWHCYWEQNECSVQYAHSTGWNLQGCFNTGPGERNETDAKMIWLEHTEKPIWQENRFHQNLRWFKNKGLLGLQWWRSVQRWVIGNVPD